MIRLISKVTRPNTKTTFYPIPSNLAPLVKIAKQEGKLIAEDSKLSEDKLTFTYMCLWSSKDDMEEFNQQDELKEFRKRRKWFEQEYEQIRSFSESEVDSLESYLRMK